jgi:DNA-binding winged helix-turn-helix (wHTH) protein
MSEPVQSPRAIHFGSYTFDLSAGELYKNGTRIRLPEQPFQILQLLLQRPGEVVTRDELQQKLWPADTFVDFETGLNSAVKKLRDVLGDSAEKPRFVETLPRQARDKPFGNFRAGGVRKSMVCLSVTWVLQRKLSCVC